MPRKDTAFQRLVLPGLAFKAAVIGAGYATGRELATFFLPSGVLGGLYGMLLVIPVWSLVCAITFLFAYKTRSFDYRTFFGYLLGPFWRLYEVGWLLALLVILAVFAAAAGEVGYALFGCPRLVGELLLVVLMAACARGGGRSVEWLFKWASVILYLTFAALVILLLLRFGDRVRAAFDSSGVGPGWISGGLTYSGYNIIGAVVILPVTRHLRSERDAVVAGALAGPLSMIPALFFFVGMSAFYEEIRTVALPSDLLLQHLAMPWFRILFQAMIFCALLESGTSGLHAVNERAAQTWRERVGTDFSNGARLSLSMAVLFVSVFVAGRFGLVALVANGYRWLSYLFLVVYVIPLLTCGLWRILAGRIERLELAKLDSQG